MSTTCSICNSEKHTYKCDNCSFELCLHCFIKLRGELCPACRQELQVGDGEDLVRPVSEVDQHSLTDPILKTKIDIKTQRYLCLLVETIKDTQVQGKDLIAMCSDLKDKLDSETRYNVRLDVTNCRHGALGYLVSNFTKTLDRSLEKMGILKHSRTTFYHRFYYDTKGKTYGDGVVNDIDGDVISNSEKVAFDVAIIGGSYAGITSLHQSIVRPSADGSTTEEYECMACGQLFGSLEGCKSHIKVECSTRTPSRLNPGSWSSQARPLPPFGGIRNPMGMGMGMVTPMGVGFQAQKIHSGQFSLPQPTSNCNWSGKFSASSLTPSHNWGGMYQHGLMAGFPH